MKRVVKFKQYNYNFVGGGWNQETAKTKRGAIKQAKKRWEDCINLTVDENSFRLATEKDTDNLMSLFY